MKLAANLLRLPTTTTTIIARRSAVNGHYPPISMSLPPNREAWLVYDGECPLCSNYTQHLRVKEAVSELRLVDAREGGPLVDEIRNLPHDLDDGMVLKMDGRYYIGHEALHVLALLSEKRGAFSRLNRLVFSSPWAARLCYPLLKSGRWVMLKVKGIPPLDR